MKTTLVSKNCPDIEVEMSRKWVRLMQGNPLRILGFDNKIMGELVEMWQSLQSGKLRNNSAQKERGSP